MKRSLRLTVARTASNCRGELVVLTLAIACASVLGLVVAPDALAVGDWTYISSGSPASSSTDEIQLTWDAESSNPPRYEVFMLPVAVPSDPHSIWCATQDGHEAGVTVGEPDGNPNEFECDFGAYVTSGGGAAGITTTAPIPCDAAIQQKFSWDGSTFYPEDDLTPPGCGGGSRSPGGGSQGSGGSSSPSVNVSAKSSTKAQGTRVLLDPGIRETCPTGGPACSAAESATARVRASAATRTSKVVIGHAHFTIPAGKTVTLTLKLNSGGAKLLRRLKTLRVTVTVTGSVANNKPVTTTKQITIRLPAGKR